MTKRKSNNGKARDEFVGVRFESELMDRVRALAEQEHRPVANFVRLLVIEGVDRREATESQ